MKSNVIEILNHIVMIIFTLISDNSYYLLNTNIKFPEEEYQHLVESYPGFEEII